MRRALFALVLLLTGCESRPPGPPIAVLVAGEGDGRLAQMLEDFSNATGTPLEVTWGNSSELASSLIEKTGSPADVLITDNVADIWRAADRGALRPIQSAAFDSQQAFLKDPDRYWAGLRVKRHAIFHGPDVRPLTSTVDDLGTSALAGRVCVSTSEIASNRALISQLIEDRGVKEAERLVRRWMRNLARPPFASQAELIEAVRAGECDYAIGIRTDEPVDDVATTVEPSSIDIDAVGVGRHAGNADGAQAMVDWFLRNRPVVFESQSDTHPPPVSIAGRRDEEVRLLAERAVYR